MHVIRQWPRVYIVILNSILKKISLIYRGELISIIHGFRINTIFVGFVYLYLLYFIYSGIVSTCEVSGLQVDHFGMNFLYENKKPHIAEGGFDPPTSGLWAQHASSAPLC